MQRAKAVLTLLLLLPYQEVLILLLLLHHRVLVLEAMGLPRRKEKAMPIRHLPTVLERRGRVAVVMAMLPLHHLLRAKEKVQELGLTERPMQKEKVPEPEPEVMLLRKQREKVAELEVMLPRKQREKVLGLEVMLLHHHLGALIKLLPPLLRLKEKALVMAMLLHPLKPKERE
jgi:hypothetical protein